MKILNRFLTVDAENRNFFQIIFWWEIRRILYNLIVLFFGFLSLGIISALVSLQPGEDLVEPIAVLLFAVLCNIGYTLGWFTELFVKRSTTYGPKMFKIGLIFTLFVVMLPAMIHFIFLLF